jgi:hypothetical protein
MPNIRTYTDEELRIAIANANCWADVMSQLGKSRKAASQHVQRVARRLDLDTAHFVVQARHRTIQQLQLPFTGQAVVRGRSGLSKAASWFLERGYNVSIPMEPAAYDLVVDSDDGLKRIQVKTTRMRSSSGSYRVKLTRWIYDPTAKMNAGGRHRQVPYARGSVDYFFVITQSGDMYLLPQEVVDGVGIVVLDEKYEAFLLPDSHAVVAQMEERLVANEEVAGS